MILLRSVLFSILVFVITKETAAVEYVELFKNIASYSSKVVSGVNSGWDVVTPIAGIAESGKQKQKKVLDRISGISKQIKNMDSKITSSATWTIESLKKFMQTNNQLDQLLVEINKIRYRILARAKEMRRFATNYDTLEKTTLINFAKATVSAKSDSINRLLEQLSTIYIGFGGPSSNSALFMLADNLRNEPLQVCALRQSAQQFLYTFFSDIMLTELQGYATVQFSWMILKSNDIGNFKTEAMIMRDAFQERTDAALNVLTQVLSFSDRTVWRCDPSHHIKGETYDEITKLMQGYIINEAEISDSCTGTCSDFKEARFQKCFQEPCHQPACTGKLLNCQQGNNGWYCPSSDSIRRYDYIDYSNAPTIGPKDTCSRTMRRFEGWTRGFVHCSYCFCMCDDIFNPKSDRYFNLRETISNVAENKVVTGIRFVKQNRVFHLQIQEGQLLGEGVVEPSSVQWVPVDNYNIDKVVNGVDYHTMFSDNRDIDLDDIYVDEVDQVVTGVRFKVLGSHLKIQIQLTEFHVESGKLSGKKVWKSNDQRSRNFIALSEPDVPIKTISASLPTSGNDQYIAFSNSDVRKDAAQHTVPFLDTQEVTSNPPAPLAGVGLYHKSANGFGGFVAPKLTTYDVVPHLKVITFNRKK